RKDRGTNIAAFHHYTTLGSEGALLLHHPRAKMRMNGYPRGRGGDVGLANAPRNVHAVEQDAVAFQLRLEVDASRLGELEQGLFVVEGEVALNRFQCKRAVHCAGLQVEKSEAAGQMSGQRALPGAGRAVDSNNRPAASGARSTSRNRFWR